MDPRGRPPSQTGAAPRPGKRPDAKNAFGPALPGPRIHVAIVAIMALGASVAHADGPSQPNFHEGERDLAYLAWNVTSTHIEVALLDRDGQRWNATPADVVVMLGTQGAPEPSEWYVIHFGRNATAASHDGKTLAVQAAPAQSVMVERTLGEAGDCAVVWAEAWEPDAEGKRITETLPSGRSAATAWDGPCDAGARFAAPPSPGKGSGWASAAVLAASMVVAVAVRRAQRR